MDDVMKQFMADSTPVKVTDDELQNISKLAMDQLDWETRVKAIEEELAVAKENLSNIQENLLPEAMQAVGMSEFKLSSGAKITIKNDVYASIRKDYLQQAVQWLDSHDLGGIVKDQVAVNFGRGEFDNVSELLDFCNANGFNAEEKLSVHAMTLKATVKEQMAKGVEFPDEYFSTGPLKKAIIKTK